MRSTVKELSLYIHFPYCRAKCSFCAFNKYTLPSTGINETLLLDAYKREFDWFLRDYSAGGTAVKISSIYFGGGTPSLMQPSTVESILKDVASKCNVDPRNTEITLEANPTSVETAQLLGFKHAGVNRLSLGIQALNDEDLHLLGRDHDVKDARKAIHAAQNTFERVSLDFLWGRPRQTLNGWKDELQEALSFGAEHLSIYQLILERGTPMFDIHAEMPSLWQSEDVQAKMYSTTVELARLFGYKQYEVSSFAKSADAESRHNNGYWFGRDYIGIGPGAHGRVTSMNERYRTACIRSPSQWQTQCVDSGNGVATKVRMSDKEVGRELVAQGLRTIRGITLAGISKLLPETPIEDLLDVEKLRGLAEQQFVTGNPPLSSTSDLDNTTFSPNPSTSNPIAEAPPEIVPITSRHSTVRISISACCALSLIDGSFNEHNDELRVLFDQGQDLNPYMARFAELYGGPEIDPSSEGVFINRTVIPLRKTNSSIPNLAQQQIDRSSSLPVEGHPHDIIVATLELLDQHIAGVLTDISNIQSLLQLTETYQHLEILSRYEADRDCIIRHGGLRKLSDVLAAISSHLKQSHLENGPETEAMTKLMYICIYLARMCFDPDGRFGVYVATSGRTVVVESRRPSTSLIGRATKLDSDTYSMVEALYGLLISVNNHEMPWSIMKTRIMETLGSIIASDPAVTKRSLVERDIVDSLLISIAWPSWLLEANVAPATLRAEFRNQILAWHLVHFLSRTNPACKERIVALGGYARLTALVSWTSYCCSELGPNFGSAGSEYKGFQDVSSSKSLPDDTAPAVESTTLPDYEKEYIKSRNVLSENPPEYIPHALPPPLMSHSLGLQSPELSLIFATALGCCIYHSEPLPGLAGAMSAAGGSRRSLVAIEASQEIGRTTSPDGARGQGMSSQIESFLRPLFKAVGASFMAGLGSSMSMGLDEAPYLGPEELRFITLGRSTPINNPESLFPTFNVNISSIQAEIPPVAKPVPLPRLQFAFIEFLGELLADPPETVDIDDESLFRLRGWILKWMDICKLWETLFSSPWFYFWGDEHENTHSLYATKLRQCIMRFVEYMATLPDFDNQHPVGALLGLMEKYYPSQPPIVHQASKSLRFILTHKRLITQESLRRIESLTIITPLLAKVTSNPSDMQWAVLGLLDAMLAGSNKDMAIYIYADRSTLKLLFKLAVGPSRTVAQTALARVLDLIAIVPLEYPTYGVGRAFPPPISGQPPSPSQPESGSDTGIDLLGFYFVCFQPEIATQRQLEIQCSLLGGIGTLLMKYRNDPSKSNAMRATLLKSQVFEHCLGVLSSRIPIEMGEAAFHKLTGEAIKTIASVMSGSKEARKTFKTIVGFEEIRIRLFVKGSWVAWDGLLDGLMGLALDSTDGFEAVHDNPIVRNVDAARALFSFYPHLGSELQVAFLTRLTRLASSHEMNRVILCQAGTVARLVKEVIPKSTDLESLERAIELLEVIGAHNVLVAEVRLMLASLKAQPIASTPVYRAPRHRRPSNLLGSRDTSSEVLPFYYDRVLKAMVNIAQRREYDLDSFYFSGKFSGLVLPPLQRWPTKDGFTFITWFKLEATGWGHEPEVVSEPPMSSPPLSPGQSRKSFFGSGRSRTKKSDNNSGSGSKRLSTLKVSTTSPQSSSSNIASPTSPASATPLSPIMQAAQAPRIFSFLTPAGAGAELYVIDGTLRYTVTTRNGNVSSIDLSGVKLLTGRWYFLALCHPAPKRPWTSHSEVLVYMNGAIRHKEKMDFPDSDLHSQCRVGASARMPHYDTPDALPNACHHSFPGQMSCISILEDALPVEKLHHIYALGLARYSSTLEDIAIYLEKETRASESKGWGRFTMALHPSSAKCHTDLFEGGLKSDDEYSGIVYDLIRSGGQASNATKLCKAVICSSRSMRTALRALGGPEILLPIFYNLDLPTPNVLFESDATRETGQLKRSSAGLALFAATLDGDKDAIERFTTNRTAKTLSIILQVRSSKHLDMSLLDSIMNVVKVVSGSDPEPMTEVLGALVFESRLWGSSKPHIQNELLVFLRHYAQGPERRLCRSRFGVCHFLEWQERCYPYTPVNPSLPDLRPQYEDMKALRSIVWSICIDYLSQGATQDEVAKLMAVLFGSTMDSDPVHVYEVFDTIVKAAAEPVSGVGEMFLAANGAECIVHLLRSEQREELRLLVLDFVLVLIRGQRSLDKWKKRLRFEDIGGVGRLLMERGHLLSMQIYRSLITLVLEDPMTRGSEKLDLESMKVPVLRNASALYSIWELAARPQVEEGVRIQVLRDGLALGRASKANAERIRARPGWQLLILSMVPIPNDSERPSLSSRRSRTSTSDRGPAITSLDDEETLLELAEELVSMLILDSFDLDRKGWRFAEEMVALMWASQRSDGLSVIRRVLGRLLNDLCVQLRSSANGALGFSTIKMDNVLHLLFLAEDVMFHHEGLHESLVQEMSPPESPGSGGVERSISYTSLSFSDTDVQIDQPSGIMEEKQSNPMHECADMAADYLDLLTGLVEYGMPIVGSLGDSVEKENKQKSGVVRLALRVLMGGLVPPSEKAWNIAIPHLIPILERHGTLFAEVESRARVLNVTGQMHDAFLQANDVSDHDHHLPSFQVILPVYMLMITRWRQILLSLKDENMNPLLSESVLSDAEANQQKFLQMVVSPPWKSMYERHFIPSMKIVAEELGAVLPAALKRHAKMARIAVGRARKEDSTVAHNRDHLLAAADSTIRKRRDEDILASSDRASMIDADKRTLQRQWAIMYRNLSGERGVWSSPETSPRNWKLDASENSSRMRRRLAPNPEFDDHREAAARRDKKETGVDSPRPRARTSSKPVPPPDKLKSQMSFESGEMLLAAEVQSPVGSLHGSEADIPAVVGEEDEGWSIINDDNMSVTSTLYGSEAGERVVCGAECEIIAMMSTVKGRFEVTATHIYFQMEARSILSSTEDTQKFIDQELLRDRRWNLSELRELYPRRYLLRKSAIELFFMDRTSCFFNFRSSKDRTRVLARIIALRPPSLVTPDARTPSEILRRSNYTEKWQRHEMSNFEYLMHLNTISGRTYNDLTQYPVFPWVLQDYESDTLDLTDPDVYRDLSKPIGALDDARLQNILERYRAFEDPSGRIKKFHYGTHYSSAAATLFYLLRLEPFTTLHILLQGGKFDHPDRQFHSIQACWKSVLFGSGDVKELIPEFYYMPEFLNKFDLGVKQTGAAVEDVILPPWASSPEEFIRIHREALEGDYVSEHLHEWIDLIWGYKQTGEEAVKAHNVFFYTTYEGAIDIDGIRDPVERQSLEDQINNFGQTPSQLLKRPHPKRLPKTAPSVFKSTLFSHPHSHKSYLIQLKNEGISGVVLCEDTTPSSGNMTAAGQLIEKVVSGTMLGGDRLITIANDGTYGLQRWTSTSGRDDSTPFVYEPDSPDAKRQLPQQYYTSSSSSPSQSLWAITKEGNYMFVGGHWSGAIGVISLDQGTRVGEPIPGHRDVVTCLALSDDGSVLVTGSRDTTVATWDVVTSAVRSISDAVNMRDTAPIRLMNQQLLYGHDDEVTAVAVDVEHDLVVSGSKDGTCIYYSLHGGRYFRTVRPTTNFKEDVVMVKRVLVTKQAAVLVYSETQAKDISFMHSYSINGKLLRDRMFTWQMNDIQASSDGACVVGADNKGGVSLMKPYNLQIIHRFDVSVSALSVAISNDQRTLFLGRTDGRLLIIALDARSVRAQVSASGQSGISLF
ncbi:hypothetical protein SmJEL517_g03217 [Synchytrium microbalum]|uniref:Beige protein homolog 1 n=1 Tax=Synchytrium microbalum TaxID=1806994 RepID=A0A507C3T3_9FUNG|nr:uncharacterized protein SmJEL517_g03217 [Synchytrium microbalum]TPX34048.1 hypothetical protein SmJEL517_g03217 [Synchytrium microbalum]